MAIDYSAFFDDDYLAADFTRISEGVPINFQAVQKYHYYTNSQWGKYERNLVASVGSSFIIRLAISFVTDASNCGGGIIVEVGGKYYHIDILFQVTTDKARVTINDGTTSWVTEYMTHPEGQENERVYQFDFQSDGSIIAYMSNTGYNMTTIRLEDWNNAKTEFTWVNAPPAGSWSGNTITRIGLRRSSSYDFQQVSFFAMYYEAIITLAGTASILNWNFIKVIKGISGLSQCSIAFDEQMFANLATHQANHGKYFDIFTNYGYHIVKAELRAISEQAQNVSNILYAYESKLPFLLCNYNPILNTNNMPVVVRTLDYSYDDDSDLLRDKDLVFDLNWDNKYCVFSQADLLQLIYHADADKWDVMEWSGVGTVEENWSALSDPPLQDESGDLLFTYYMDADEANNSYDALHQSPERLGIATYFDVFLSSTTIVNKITIKGVVSFRKLSAYLSDKPHILLYNHSSALWEDLKEFGAKDVGGSLSNTQEDGVFGWSQCPDISFELGKEFADNLANYLFEEGTQPDGNLIKYTLKVMIVSGLSSLVVHNIHIKHLELEIDLNTPQYHEIGQGWINVVTEIGKSIEFSTAPAWISDTPSQQGVSAGDLMYILNNLDDFITAVNLVMDGEYTFEIDITNSDRIFITDDYTFKSQRQLTEDIVKLCGGVWGVDDASKKILIKTLDNCVDSGIILTRDTILNYNEANFYSEDATVLKSKLIIEGDGILYEHTLTPEQALDVSETVIITDASIVTQTQAEARAIKEAPKFENIHRVCRPRIKLSSAFTNLEILKMITIQLPTTASATLDFSGANKMLVQKIDLEIMVDGSEYATLTCQRRYY